MLSSRPWFAHCWGPAGAPARRPTGYSAWRRHERAACAILACQAQPTSSTSEGAQEPAPKPRFLPFNPQSVARQRMMGFQRATPCEGGEVLVVQPLEDEWIRPAAEILTESFAESMGYLSVYKNFLRRQILQYLQHHVMLPPKTVVLVGRLRSQEEWCQQQAPPAQEALPCSGEGGDAALGTGGSGGGGSSDNGPAAAGGSSSSNGAGSEGSAGVGEGAAGFFPPAQPGATALSAASLSSGQQVPQVQLQPLGPERGAEQAAEAMSSVSFPAPFSIGGPADIFLRDADASGSSPDGAGASPSSSSSSSSMEEEAHGAASPSSGGSGGGGAVVGVVEVSFTASTRTKYITLNPPEDRPYLCNMAVAPEHRGRGHGRQLLQAAEELVSFMGESEIYLHVRVQDEAAAKLYRRAGFQTVKEDSFFVLLLRRDRRLLMRKRLR